MTLAAARGGLIDELIDLLASPSRVAHHTRDRVTAGFDFFGVARQPPRDPTDVSGAFSWDSEFQRRWRRWMALGDGF